MFLPPFGAHFSNGACGQDVDQTFELWTGFVAGEEHFAKPFLYFHRRGTCGMADIYDDHFYVTFFDHFELFFAAFVECFFVGKDVPNYLDDLAIHVSADNSFFGVDIPHGPFVWYVTASKG